MARQCNLSLVIDFDGLEDTLVELLSTQVKSSTLHTCPTILSAQPA